MVSFSGLARCWVDSSQSNSPPNQTSLRTQPWPLCCSACSSDAPVQPSDATVSPPSTVLDASPPTQNSPTKSRKVAAVTPFSGKILLGFSLQKSEESCHKKVQEVKFSWWSEGIPLLRRMMTPPCTSLLRRRVPDNIPSSQQSKITIILWWMQWTLGGRTWSFGPWQSPVYPWPEFAHSTWIISD